MPTALVNGAELFYTEVGVGVPCIALHGGLGFDHTYFSSTFGPLEEVLRLVYLDQRGNGRSERVALETITIPQLADDVEGLRDHLGIERVALLGHSYGGFVALEYATRHPDRLSQLVLVDTSPGVFEPSPDELAERPDPSWVTESVERGLGAFAEMPTTNEAFAAWVPRIAPGYMRSADPDVLSQLMSSSILDADAMHRGFEVLPGWSVVGSLDRITCPTLVMCGRYDLQTTPECSKRLATAIRGAELVWFENSGHFPWLEEPEPFFDAVKRFVKKTSGSKQRSPH